MRKVVALSRVAMLTRVSVACVLAASVSACSSDTARLSDNPFSNPFASSTAAKGASDPVATGSIGKTSSAGSSTGTGLLGGPVSSAPLAPIAAKPLASAPAVTPRASVASPATTGSLATGSLAKASARPAAMTGALAGWSAEGGTPVVMAHGESVDTLSGRYGVPAGAILAANGLAGGARPTPGTKVIIPVYNAAAKAGGTQVAQTSAFSSDMARNTPVPPAPVTSAVEGAKAKARLAAEAKAEAKAKSDAAARIEAAEARAAAAEARAKADQQARLAAEERVNAAAKARTATDSASKAQAIKAAAEAKAKSDAAAKAVADLKAREKAAAVAEAKAKAPSTDAAEKLKLAAEAKARAAETAKAAEKLKAEEKARLVAEAKAKAEAKALADAKARQSTKVASVPAPAPVEEPKTTSSVAKEEPAKAPTADFRWPARGRVINGFSGKGGNEGINIAVPEGTPVKAAEGGVVAYSGNELKGYGNLVLIRHDNGYVSAYAHNGDISVKRGEKVTRGQTIAKSGQSGNVSSPQLHFELRKGSSPVDPMPYLDN